MCPLQKKKSCFRSNFLECYGVGFVGALFPLPDEALFTPVHGAGPLACSPGLLSAPSLFVGFALWERDFPYAWLAQCWCLRVFPPVVFLLISLGFYLFCLLRDFTARHPYPFEQARVKEINNSKANTHKKERVLSRSLVPLAKLLWYLRELHAYVLTGY